MPSKVGTQEGTKTEEIKVIDGVEHKFDPSSNKYIPISPSEKLRKAVIGAGEGLWKKLTGKKEEPESSD